MPETSRRPPANGFVKAVRHVYNPLGFSKGYNFILWFITIGYLMGFVLARLEYFSYYGIFCNPHSSGGAGGADPMECYFYLRDPEKIGMMLHLFTILPAGFLVCFQFVPVIRHQIKLFHRINGYLVILLSLVSNAGAIIVAQHAFGGDLATRVIAGILVISTTLGYAFAVYNIWRLQIDQHRAWMMRTWGYYASIVTTRLIMIISAQILKDNPDAWVTRPCYQLASVIGQNKTLATYPGCQSYFNGTSPNQHVAVQGSFGTSAVGVNAGLGFSFGASLWLAFWIHALAIELYLRLTPAESQRLRAISYERQLARGFKNPGSAGLVAQRFGDANPYIPPPKEENARIGSDSDISNVSTSIKPDA